MSDFRDFIIWERESKDTIDFKKIYVDMAGDLKAGLMLSQIVYWRLPRKNRSEEDSRLTIEHEGRMWLAKSDKDWWGEIRLSEKEAPSARRVLEQRGIISMKTKKFAGTPTTHISINEERFMELWNLMLATPLEERQAGRIEDKIKREKYVKPGTKPRSGNWRKNTQPPLPEDGEGEAEGTPPEAPTEPPIGEKEGGSGESGNYEKRNLEITESVISELRKGQFPNYGKDNLGITERVISLTESPAETPPESPSENPSSSTSGSPEAVTVPVQDDDDFSAGAEPHSTQLTVEGNEGLPLTRNGLTKMEGGETETKIPALETVPGGAALLALAPIPRQVLEARPARDPLEMRSLRALLFCSNKSRIGELHTRLSIPTSVKGIPRELFTRLTDDEIQQAIAAARLDVSLTTGGFERLAVLGLDHLIGEPLTLAMIKGETETRSAPAPQGRAYDVKNEPARAAAPEQPVPPAEDALPADFGKWLGLWELKANPAQVVDVVHIEDRPGKTPLLHLKTEDTLSVTDIALKYRRPAYAAD